MAAAKKETETTEEVHDNAWWDEPVECEFFKDGERYSNDIYVNINGQSWLIQRGVKVSIPRKVLAVIEESMQSDKNAAERREQFQKNSIVY